MTEPTAHPDPIALPFPDGLRIKLGTRTYVLASLNATAARRNWDRIRAMKEQSEADAIDLTVKLVTECLRRNYPDITEEWVGEHVDMDNWEGLSTAVFGRGAFRRWADQASKDDVGNVLALLCSPATSTGAPSTPLWPLPPAGASPTSVN